jgi:hypothetical protein
MDTGGTIGACHVSTPQVESDTRWQTLTREEGRRLFEERAQTYMHMSGAEFKRKWDAGEIEDPDRFEVLHVAFLLPWAE